MTGSRSAAGALAGTAGLDGGTGSTALIAGALGGARVGLSVLGHNDIARSAWAVMVSAGLTPEVGRDGRAVDDVQARDSPNTRW